MTTAIIKNSIISTHCYKITPLHEAGWVVCERDATPIYSGNQHYLLVLAPRQMLIHPSISGPDSHEITDLHLQPPSLSVQ